MATPELLEAIISLLPVRDIFANAQRVSRTWNAVAQLPSVQTRLWLRSPTEEVASPIKYLAGHSRSDPPTLHLPSYLPIYSGSVAHNPTCISKAADYRTGTAVSATVDGIYHRTSLAIPRTSSYATRPTWFDMQLTEPRIRIAHLHIQQPRSGPYKLYSATWASVRDEDGLTFGTVLDIAWKVCDDFHPGLPGRDEADVVVWFLTEH
jgi:hypothetical protein